MSTANDETPEQFKVEEVRKIVQRALGQLMEHFDTAHVFVSQYDPKTKETHFSDLGEGSFLARFGHIRGWADVQADVFTSPDTLRGAGEEDVEGDEEDD